MSLNPTGTSRPAMRLTEEIPTNELGLSCIYCGLVVESGSVVESLMDAQRYGLELHLHHDCARRLSVGQVASAAAIRVHVQLERGFYAGALHVFYKTGQFDLPTRVQ